VRKSWTWRCSTISHSNSKKLSTFWIIIIFNNKNNDNENNNNNNDNNWRFESNWQTNLTSSVYRKQKRSGKIRIKKEGKISFQIFSRPSYDDATINGEMNWRLQSRIFFFFFVARSLASGKTYFNSLHWLRSRGFIDKRNLHWSLKIQNKGHLIFAN